MKRFMTDRWCASVCRPLLIAAALLMAVPATAGAQAAGGKRPLTHDDYDGWKSIRGQQISADGRWVLYQIQPQDGEGELVVRSTRSETEYRHERGTGASFTRDNRYVVFLIAPPEDSVKAAQKAKKKGPNLPKRTLAIMDLSDGGLVTVERVKSFRLPAEAGGWLAYLKEEPPTEEEEKGEEEQAEEPAVERAGRRRGAAGARGQAGEEERGEEKDFGTELILRALTDGSETTFASVLDYRFTEKGDWLLYIVSSEESPETDGVYAHSRVGRSPRRGSPARAITGGGP